MRILLILVVCLAIVHGQVESSVCDQTSGFHYDPFTNLCLFPIDNVTCSSDYYPVKTTDGIVVCVPLLMTVECEEGKVWDPSFGRCIPELSLLFCNDASEYDMTTGLCRPFIQPVYCATGYVWNEFDNVCVVKKIASPSSSPTPSSMPSPSTVPLKITVTPSSTPTTEGGKVSSTPIPSASNGGKKDPSVTPEITPSRSVSSSPLPPKPVISTSLLFRPPPNGTLDKSSFSDDVLDSIVSAAATVLGISSNAVRVSGVEPVTANELAAVTNSTRLRLLGSRFLQSIVGYRVVLAIDAAAAATSPVIASASGNGTALSINNLAQVATAVATAVTQTTSSMLNILAQQPSVLNSLGYASSAQLINSVSVDPTRPTVAIQSSSVIITASNSNGSSNISDGAIAGIVIGVLIAVAIVGGMYVRIYRAPNTEKPIMSPRSPIGNSSANPTLSSMENGTVKTQSTIQVDYVNPMSNRSSR